MDRGEPTGIVNQGRRKSAYVVPIPAARKKSAQQGALDLDDAGQELTENDFINEIRSYVDAWRTLPPGQWGVSHETERLLKHWRDPNREQRFFFCQLEAMETAIWLADVAPKTGKRFIDERLKTANAEANPDLFRIALKMATGSGKTMVMAMLIAWQAVKKVRHKRSTRFSDAFLVICPGITIRDRLRVLLPSDPENYYETRNLVPRDMLDDVRKARLVITNYHAFKLRETLTVPKLTKEILKGRGQAPQTMETEGQMLQRVCKPLLGRSNVIVLNDEAHHCYRENVKAAEQRKLDAEEKAEAERNAAAARLWISGIEALNRALRKTDKSGKETGGVSAVYDLSATPFFLRGSGYREGALFPWVVSDFSLMDAIESGIVKVPRVPVSDNQVGGQLPVYRELYKHISDKLPKKGRAKQKQQEGGLDPEKLPSQLYGALTALFDHYRKTFELWVQSGLRWTPLVRQLGWRVKRESRRIMAPCRCWASVSARAAG
jgi:type III restriction enzyme